MGQLDVGTKKGGCARVARWMGPSRGRSGGRGRGRVGHGNSTRQRSPPRKRSSQDAGLDSTAEEDDVTSPMKTGAERQEMPVAETARRNLNPVLSDSSATTEGLMRSKATDIADTTLAVPPPPPAYVSPRDAKKAKKTGSPLKQGTDKLALLAGSSPEHRQAQ